MKNEQSPKWTVTGLTWNAETREHDKLSEITFERRVDADGFISMNKNWIKGMVLDRNAAAIAADSEATK